MARLSGADCGGNAEALSRLYRETVSLLLGLAVRMLGDQHDAEEVVLEVYEQVWRTARSYDSGRSRVLWWLTMMTRSRALDRLRASKRRVSLEVPIPETFDAAAADPEPDARSPTARSAGGFARPCGASRVNNGWRWSWPLCRHEPRRNRGAAGNTPWQIKSRIRSALRSLRYALDDNDTVAGQTA